MQAQNCMTRATKRGMAGRIWPAGRKFDTPVMNELTSNYETTELPLAVVT